MHERLRPIGVLFMASLAATAGGFVVAQNDGDADPGRAAYVEMGCYQCHGYQGQGARSTGPRIAPDPLPFDVFSSWVRRPPLVMPAYSPAVLSEEKLRRIHEYLASIPPPPDVEAIPILSER